MLIGIAPLTAPCGAGESVALRDRLRSENFKIAWEAYVDGNSEIFVMNADGSDAVEPHRARPAEHEHYPQISPDGRKICFNVDAGEGRDAVRSLWLMDIDGQNRKKIADRAREPFWSPDGKVIGYLPQEYPKFDVIDYYTKGMMYYHLDTGQIRAASQQRQPPPSVPSALFAQREMDRFHRSRRHGIQPRAFSRSRLTATRSSTSISPAAGPPSAPTASISPGVPAIISWTPPRIDTDSDNPTVGKP